MAIFEYKAKNELGEDMEGALEASSQTQALEMLNERRFVVYSLVEQAPASAWQFSLKFFNRVKPKDLVIFSRQLAVMAQATVPLLESLRILIKQTESESLRVIVSDVADEVEGGAKLSAALNKYPDVFSEFFINMIRSGETSGRLDDTLNYLADEAEKNNDLMSKIKGAMIYPAFILFGLGTVGIVMMVFVVPKLTAILTEQKTELPLATRMLIGTSNFLQHQWWVIVIVIILGFFGLRYALKTYEGKKTWHFIQLRLPVFGNLFRKVYLVRFTRSLATLIKGGVPLTKSLEIVAGVVGNIIYRELIVQTIKEVEEGNSISTVFLSSDVVPTMVSQMMVVGEKTGRLEEVLQRLADFYGREVSNLIANLVTLVEPMIMVIIGLAVGVMVAAVLMPMYNLAGSF